MPLILGKQAINTLRQAAIERIRFFQEALAERGIIARIGTELEFFPLNKSGLPQKDILDAKKLTAALRKNVRGIERVHPESITSRAQYELVTGPNPKMKGAGIADASPLAAAETVDAFKTGLINHADRLGLGGISFKARQREGNSLHTSGLHINMSLWDSAGRKNLFYQPLRATSDIERHVVDSLIKTHATAAPAYFPNPDSYERIPIDLAGLMSTAPTHAAYMSNKGSTISNAYQLIKGLVAGEPKIGSIAGRHADLLHAPFGAAEGLLFRGHRSNWIGWERPRMYRLEGRLAGADADPYVAIASELASAYEAVRGKVRPYVHGMSIDKANERIIKAGERSWVVAKHDGKFASHRLSLDNTAGHEALVESVRMRELLGEDLYHGIVATTKPLSISTETANAVAESEHHFQDMVRRGHNRHYDTTDITPTVIETINGLPASVVRDAPLATWKDRLRNRFSDGKSIT
ncbi:MAG: hypothetical protein AB7L92_00630 [Alphaproteobacteria bacterium]